MAQARKGKGMKGKSSVCLEEKYGKNLWLKADHGGNRKIIRLYQDSFIWKLRMIKERNEEIPA